jgi:DNA-binding CsgD family transcriptional regulator
MEARPPPPVVGRARELWELERALAATQKGSGTTALIAGEAGIGKTRLASELALRARAAGFEALLGRSIDLVGTELPYQPFVEALRPLGGLREDDDHAARSQLQVFEETRALLADRATTTPVLLVLEDLHWADTSTLDLVVFLAHNVEDLPVLLVATFRADELSSAERVHRLAEGVRRSGSALMLELGPLERGDLTTLLAARTGGLPATAVTDAIVARSEGNPFFAEELLEASGERAGELPRGLRDVLLRRVSGLDDQTQGVLRLAAAAGRDVGYPLLRGAATLPERRVRESLRRAVDHGVLVADQETGSFRFRHALLAEAIYTTILPGEREELHAKLADELARSGAASPAELAPHWQAAGRSTEAFTASVEAARQAEAVFGLAEAHSHLERALPLWDEVPDAAELAGLDLAALCAWAAKLADQVAAAARAVELSRRAIELVGTQDAHRAVRMYVDLGEYLFAIGSNKASLAAFEHAVDLAQGEPQSPEQAYALGTLAGVLMVAGRHAESLPICEQALALARLVGAREAEVRALTVRGCDLAYLGRADEGVADVRNAMRLAEEIGDHLGLERAYLNLTDALTMLGRLGESARVGQTGLEVTRRYGIDSPLLVSNQIETLLANGRWDEAETLSAGALRGIASNFPDALLILRAGVEIGRGEFASAHAHLDAALAILGEDRAQGMYDVYLVELALWERRWADAAEAVSDALALARVAAVGEFGMCFCAKGIRAYAELTALARAGRNHNAVGHWLARAQNLVKAARRAAETASPITPNADGWLALAEAEYERARNVTRAESWSEAAAAWDRLERPPLAAYCRWREAEALVAAGASRIETGGPLRAAYAVADRLDANPLRRELELLAERARLDLAPDAAPSDEDGLLEKTLGLTTREAEVLTLVARGYTNREIAAALVISVKTAGVHVSHILSKLGAANRIEAAAIAHRLLPYAGDRP